MSEEVDHSEENVGSNPTPGASFVALARERHTSLGFETEASVKHGAVQYRLEYMAFRGQVNRVTHPWSLGVRKSGSVRLNTSDKPEGTRLQIQFGAEENRLAPGAATGEWSNWGKSPKKRSQNKYYYEQALV